MNKQQQIKKVISKVIKDNNEIEVNFNLANDKKTIQFVNIELNSIMNYELEKLDKELYAFNLKFLSINSCENKINIYFSRFIK